MHRYSPSLLKFLSQWLMVIALRLRNFQEAVSGLPIGHTQQDCFVTHTSTQAPCLACRGASRAVCMQAGGRGGCGPFLLVVELIWFIKVSELVLVSGRVDCVGRQGVRSSVPHTLLSQPSGWLFMRALTSPTKPVLVSV